MRLTAITAEAHASGNQIDLSWQLPTGAEFPNVRVMRREGSYPTHPNDGSLVAEGPGLQTAQDNNLKSETVYYYSLFPYRGDPREYDYERRNRIAAVATGYYDHGERMYELLPAVYHRYDTELPNPAEVAPEDSEKAQLRRMLDIPGGQLDQLYSLARFLPKTRDTRQTPGDVLPLLAQWIGWKTDTLLEYESQRNEIRNAPHLYHSVGIIPTIGATVKRISGWESRSKEFVHNVHLSNAPERLNLWAMRAGSGGVWPTTGELLSLDHAFDGRPELVRQGDTLWLFYHTPRNDQWDIWYKTYDIGTSQTWSPSQRLSNLTTVDKHPSASNVDDTLWLFWTSFDEDSQLWSLNGETLNGGNWSSAELPTASGEQRRQPVATAVGDSLWLFWLERSSEGWRLQYDSRTNLAPWGGQIALPDDVGGLNPRVEEDLHVVFQPPLASPRLFIFWVRKSTGPSPGQQRWEIAYRVKTNLNQDASGWSNVRVISKTPVGADWHDKQPFAFVNGAGELELFWASNREQQGWSIWRSRLTSFDANLIAGNDTWEVPQRVTDGMYTQSHPAILDAGISEQWLIYRSNEHLLQQSAVYGATTIVDERYNGSLSADLRHTEKHAQRGNYDDFQTYSYDTKQENEDWYARDTVGVYLNNDTLDETAIAQNIERLTPVLKEFMPLTDRAVFMSRADQHSDYVYSYGQPLDSDSHTITESYNDELNGVLVETLFSPDEDFNDALE